MLHITTKISHSAEQCERAMNHCSLKQLNIQMCDTERGKGRRTMQTENPGCAQTQPSCDAVGSDKLDFKVCKYLLEKFMEQFLLLKLQMEVVLCLEAKV